MKIVEILKSLQGEGPHIGTPAWFIRLAGCNLRCPWCDTKRSWKDSGDGVMEVEPEWVFAQITRPPSHVVITGGEPLLQREELLTLVNMLVGAGYTIDIETNGTLEPLPPMEEVTYIVSPKPLRDYRMAEAWGTRRDWYLKVVMDPFNENHVKWAKRIVREYGKYSRGICYQPMDGLCIGEPSVRVARRYLTDVRYAYRKFLELIDSGALPQGRVLPQLHKLLALP